MEEEKSVRSHTIIGQIIPRERDNSLFGIEIMTDEGPYRVELDYVGDQLLDFLYHDIRATGFLINNRNGKKRIVLEDFEVVDA